MSEAIASGDVWTLAEPQRPGQDFPVLVISVDRFNQGPAEFVIAVPLSGRDHEVPLHVSLEPPEGGVMHRSFAITEGMGPIQKNRLGRRMGRVAPETMERLKDRIRILLDL